MNSVHSQAVSRLAQGLQVEARAPDGLIEACSCAKAAGFNLVRVHVHVELDVFYALCSELGIAVMQDSEYNWMHPVIYICTPFKACTI